MLMTVCAGRLWTIPTAIESQGTTLVRAKSQAKTSGKGRLSRMVDGR